MSRDRLWTIKHTFTKEEIRMYRKHFDSFDLNGDGVISAKELYQVSQTMGYRMSKQEIKDIMRATDLDESGSLSFDEFILAMPGNASIPMDKHKAAEIRRKFMEYDRDSNGHVTAEEAHYVLRKELAFTPHQTVKLVETYDKNGDGQLSYEEFVHFYITIKSKANQIRDIFDQFDSDHSGTVSVEEAKRILRRINIPDEEIECLVYIHDRNKDGELQYEEFVTFLLSS